jgi:NTE family protein
VVDNGLASGTALFVGEPVESAAPSAADRRVEVFPFDQSSPSNDATPLGDLALFATLSDATRARIEAIAEEVSLLAGEWLFSAGDTTDGLYLVRTGRLEVIRDGVVVQELGHGGTLGELGVLTGAPRAASVRAKRDSHLLRIGAEQFDEISVADPVFLRAISATVAGWLQNSRTVTPAVTTRAAVIALIGLDRDAPVAAVERVLVKAVGRHLRIVAPGRVESNGLERAEATHDRVLLTAGVDDPAWRSFCLRQADRVILVSGRPGQPEQPAEQSEREADLVLVGQRADRATLSEWCEVFAPRTVLQVEPDADLAAQLRPLAARIAGRSIGLVLGGGGARALAHIGVLEELEAAGVHIDRVAGSSFGALIGAMYATGRSPREIDAVCYDGLVRRNPLNDYTVPTRGLARGAKMQAAINGFFGDLLIDELPREFCAVSVDLLAREPVVHRRGRLVDAIGASVRLPGLFPPYVIGDRLHVDGGVMDNLPVSALADRDEGPIIAVNISTGSGNGRPPGGRPRIPALGDTLMRSMMLSSGATSAAALARADLVIAPDARGVGLLEFHQLDQVRAAGRQAAREALRGLTATDDPAPADGPTAALGGERRRPRPYPRVPAAQAAGRVAGQSQECSVERQ